MVEFTQEALGWCEWFAAQADRCGAHANSVARVAAVDRDQLLLVGTPGFFRARISGKYWHAATQATQAAQLPCVGDWVCVQKSPDNQMGLVHGILDRRTFLRRKAPGESQDHQMIAANVDCVIVVQACLYDFNLKRLERYLVMVKEGRADALILLTKTDLVPATTLAALVAELRQAGITEPVVTVSSVTQQGIEDFRSTLQPRKTYCFVGSSGVGKSTLINALLGQAQLETGTVSGTGEGRHTTVRRELIVLGNGALVIDNPGMREFGILGADSSVEASYSDITMLAAQCLFRDCTHGNERDCAVRAALTSGKLSAEHYDNFVKLKKEARHNELSHAEKRRKDREFGRFLKGVKKDLNDD